MKVLDSLAGLRLRPRPRSFCLGVFDGVHRGHQAVLAEAARWGLDLGGESVAITFDPHPAAVLRGLKVSLLCTLARRLDLIATQGMDFAVVLRFDQALARQTAETFLSGTLAGAGLKGLVLGYDSHFGHDREGDAKLAAELGPRLGFALRSLEAVPVGGRPASSRRIREALQAGDVEDAAACLGRPWELEGKVVKGDGRGRTLGFPTANLETGGLILPKAGVYAGLWEGRKAAVNVGTRPTVGGAASSLPLAEVHVPGWEGELYGKRVSVSLLRRIRDERKFESLEVLKRAIAEDLAGL